MGSNQALTKAYKQQCWRLVWVSLFLLIAFLGLSWRMLQLTVLERDFLQRQGELRRLRTLTLPASRGVITDRNGHLLAISIPTQSIWINPKQIELMDPKLEQLASLLDLPLTKLKTQIKKQSHREFYYLKRQLPTELAEKIEALSLAGVYTQNEYHRFYPEGEVTAHVLGFTNIDDQGQEGLELRYEQSLQGTPGKKQVIKDRLGHVVSVVDDLQSQRPGQDLTLSLDYRIQHMAYQVLQQAVKTFAAKSGSVVVLDVNTGEVLAMVNQPSYNPNQHHGAHDSRYRNRAVTDVFEPGSTLKAFAVANALSNGHFEPDTLIDTSPGWMVLNGKMVRDPINRGQLSVTQILQKSSNVGVSKLSLALDDPASLQALLAESGFGVLANGRFPGEVKGYLPMPHHWAPFSLATLSFGYGLSVTNLQLARAYAMLAAGGVIHPVSFLKQSEGVAGRQVLPQKVARQVVEMLEQVVDSGTAHRAQLMRYRVAGKTGTVRLVGPKGYQKDHHMALFVGMAPVSKPRVVVSVAINDPQQGSYYGGVVAAPVFARVIQNSLRLLEVTPDKEVS